MSAAVDLDRYFDRIAWGGDTRPTHATLAGLLAAHTAHIPFENLDVLLGRPIRLDLATLQDKLVRQRRGGYCFEQTTLFAAVLEQLGFVPRRHTARVVLVAERDAAPRTHMFLVVPLPEGEFVVDPGFGALAPRRPVPLDGTPVAWGDETWSLANEAPYRVLRVQTDGKAVDAWVTTLDADNVVDFEVGNHYTSTWPESPFANRLMLRVFTANGRVTLMNRELTVRRGVDTIKTQVEDRAALRVLLATHAGFDLPEIEQLRVPTIPEWT
jgi:N-hydroxyarylamine O-acetyltransferase